MARRLRGGRVSHGLARALAAAVLGLVAAGLVTLAIVLLWSFVRGRVGDLPAVLEKMGDTLARLKETLEAAGVSLPLPAHGGSTEAVAGWLRENAGALRHAGTVGARDLSHALLGSVVGVLVFFHAPAESSGPLAAALAERLRRFGAAFPLCREGPDRDLGRELRADGALRVRGPAALRGEPPAPGNARRDHVPLRPRSRGREPGVEHRDRPRVARGIALEPRATALAFLVVIHKLEYLLNAKIVGGRIGASAWETLLAILVMEAAFGIPGVVLAPVVYAWAKSELVARGLV